LISWTSNVLGWTAHGSFEISNKFQTIEILTALHDDAGEFIGLSNEVIMYDMDALVEPVRLIDHMMFVQPINEGNPHIFVECNPTIYPVDGYQQNISPGQTFDYTQPDWFGRPWAQIWEKYHEDGMSRPEAEALFGF
jgi:hypothetical protein